MNYLNNLKIISTLNYLKTSTMKKYLKLKNLLYVIIVVFAIKGFISSELDAILLLALLPYLIFIVIFALIIKLIFKIFAKNRNFSALKFSKKIIIYFLIIPVAILSFLGLVTTEINEKPIGEIVITYYNNTFNNKEKSNSKITKVSFSQAETFMSNRCKKINQKLMKGKESEMNGIKIYAFMSVAQNGMTCISLISENKLEILSSDCGNTQRKMNEFNNL